jgi:hypothetical protein
VKCCLTNFVLLHICENHTGMPRKSVVGQQLTEQVEEALREVCGELVDWSNNVTVMQALQERRPFWESGVQFRSAILSHPSPAPEVQKIFTCPIQPQNKR